MANTLKFGNGEWATKEGSTLAYNDENGNFKPLPFDFSRSTTATRVNKQGLIEVVSNNEPRIDFLNDSDGALKLEPQRTNLYTYSEDLTQGAWTKLTNSTAVANVIISPDGTQNSSEVKAVATSTSILCVQDSFAVSSGVSYTVSFFAKKGVARYIQLFHGGSQVTGNARTNFDLEDGGVTVSDAGHTSTIEDFGNGWFRCVVELNTLTTTLQTYFNAVKEPNALRSATSSWSANDNFYFWGAQLEEGYATSYIPTQGSIGTRVSEFTTKTNPLSLENDFCIFWEGKVLEDDIMLVGSGTDAWYLNYNTSSGRIILDELSGRKVQAFLGSGSPVNVKTKILIRRENGVHKVFANGTKLVENQSVNSTTTLSLKSVGWAFSSSFYKGLKINNLQIFNTALTDAECIALTTI